MIVLRAKINLVIYWGRRRLRIIFKCWCTQVKRWGDSNLWPLNDLRFCACRKLCPVTLPVTNQVCVLHLDLFNTVFFLFLFFQPLGIDGQTQKQLVSIKCRSYRGCRLQSKEEGTMRVLNQGESSDHFVISSGLHTHTDTHKDLYHYISLTKFIYKSQTYLTLDNQCTSQIPILNHLKLNPSNLNLD